MNYKHHYDLLITKAKNRNLLGYKEKHHIVPRSVGGTDQEDNLVDLTAREHFLAHLLLVKIYNYNYKLVKAVAMMCVGQKERKITNRLYGKMRNYYSEAMSISQTGNKNSQFGTKWIYNLELKICKKIPKNEDIPKGWNLGRVINFNKYLNKKIKKNLVKKDKLVNKESKKEDNKKLAYELYNIYTKGEYNSIREFCRLKKYSRSHVSLTKLWKKYIPEYKEIVKQGKRYIPE